MLYINKNGKLDKISPVKTFDNSLGNEIYDIFKNAEFKQVKNESGQNIKYKTLFIGNILFSKNGGPWTSEEAKWFSKQNKTVSLSKMPSNINETGLLSFTSKGTCAYWRT